MLAQNAESTARRIATAPQHYRGMITRDDARFAVIRGARTVKEALAYLPGNYDLMESFPEERPGRAPGLVVIIGGYDNAGWTLEDYVIPRLASGLMGCEEIA